MAGHNKWSKVKRIKGAIDAKRGKLFSKLAKEIAVAAKLGGPDPDANVRLRSAIALARTQNMPNDNIERAIKRGSGDTGEAALEEVMYEGYAADGVALLIEAATDNRNRTAADVRLIFSKNGGHLGGAGSVAHLFSRKGEITVPEGASDPDRLLELALEAEADELTSEPGQPHVGVRIRTAQLRGDGDLLRQLGEKFPPLGVDRAFDALDFGPLVVTGHEMRPVVGPDLR